MSHAFGPSSGRQEGSAEPPVVLSEGPEDPSIQLVRSIQQGIDRDESSRQLVELHRPRVHNFFRKKGFDPEEIRDLTQDVFQRVFQSIDTFRGESTFEWWLKTVAESVWKNELRRRGAEKRDGIEQSLDESPVPDNDSRPKLELAAPGNDVLEDVIHREQLAKIRAALQDLPPQMRQCCLLRYEQNLKYQEIATVMNISVETVKAHLFQAKKRLTHLLGDKDPT
jgi:RNA polymerase sigma-70 factor, ECF subfamily